MADVKDIEFPDTDTTDTAGETAGATEAGVGAADYDEEALRERVETALDTIRPAIAMDGGNVELLDIEDGVVTLRMMGACGGCPLSTMTLKQGIEQRLREMVPGVTRVDAI